MNVLKLTKKKQDKIIESQLGPWTLAEYKTHTNILNRNVTRGVNQSQRPTLQWVEPLLGAKKNH